jgi:hypothetical protein
MLGILYTVRKEDCLSRVFSVSDIVCLVFIGILAIISLLSVVLLIYLLLTQLKELRIKPKEVPQRARVPGSSMSRQQLCSVSAV